jgi:hypothetical protein
VLTLIRAYGPEGAFAPDQVAILVGAFDDDWHQLEKSGVRFADNQQKEDARAFLGRKIIEEARRGEWDRIRLQERALLLYSQSQLPGR